MFDIINRDALILFPKKPLTDWVKYVQPTEKIECPEVLEHDEGNVYLIPESDHHEDAIEWLKLNYEVFFECELYDWCTDQSKWPSKRTWELFESWFHFSIQSMVMDAGIGKIEKEEY